MTHLDPAGRVRMVDVGDKPVTRREAVAAGTITMNARAFEAVRRGTLAKGDIAPLARIAGIAAAKRTADLVPLCHPVPLDHVAVDVRLDKPARAVHVEARVRTRWSTGVEMEALAAVAAALLTVYDVAKAIDRGMQIDAVRLLHKSGGRSGTYQRSGRNKPRAR
ncbi:MAG TPA: cyclic pyranopterin monophosphate synthase MoaC [Candidatus Polarisedimenticolia bacterium]|nr:cyclic pyranopterin monophosphate synthase MoaC [Candidatus Polarisedimenticolia bacterium]